MNWQRVSVFGWGSLVMVLVSACTIFTDTDKLDTGHVHGPSDARGELGAEEVGEEGEITCAAYCTEVMDACRGEDAVYMDREDCRLHCERYAGWPGGIRGTYTVNTIGCRLEHALFALAEGPSLHCPHAGPTGGAACGSWCDNYCTLEDRNCRAQGHGLFASVDACLSACLTLPDAGMAAARDNTGDSVQCRINHLLYAGHNPPSSAGDHCPHARPVGTPPCVGTPPSSAR